MQVSEAVQETVRCLRMMGVNLEPPNEITNAELREAKRALRGDGGEVNLPVPARLRTVTSTRAPKILGRWTASVIHAAVDRVSGPRDRRTAVTLALPGNNRLEVALGVDSIQIQQL